MTSPSPAAGRLIITVDGPAGSGKSTVAHRLAERLGLEVLDTGAMYRAVALIGIERGIAPDDGEALAAAAAETDMRFDWTIDPPRLHLGDRDVGDRIRDMDVSSIVSLVAAQKPVRDALVRQQRRIAEAHARLVTEGRDQGSVVFPDAPVRFFLEADVAERARRRVAQFAEAGKIVDQADVIADIEQRDRIDSTRADGPLHCPDGAISVNTSDLSIDQVVAVLEGHARAALSQAGIEP